jgi:transcription termination factor Rho
MSEITTTNQVDAPPMGDAPTPEPQQNPILDTASPLDPAEPRDVQETSRTEEAPEDVRMPGQDVDVNPSASIAEPSAGVTLSDESTTEEQLAPESPVDPKPSEMEISDRDADADSGDERTERFAASRTRGGEQRRRSGNVATPRERDDADNAGKAAIAPPANVTIAVPNLPPPPDSLDLNELHDMALSKLIELASKYGLRLGHERSRHQVIFELIRRFLLLGTKVEAEGILETNGDNTGLLRWPKYNFLPCPEDIFVGHGIIKPFHLRPAQRIRVSLRPQRDTREKYLGAAQLITVEGKPAAEWVERTAFDNLTPCHPRERIVLDNPITPSVSARAVDLVAPLGKGQRGLIVAPPRAGKTILLKEVAKAIRAGNPAIQLLILLVDERPEEVTDFRRSVDAEIYSSTFDEAPARHVQVAELLGERAKRLVELGKDVVILIDSITRLSRGYNSLQPGKGRIMSGGVESKALMKPKRFFGSARNVEEGGSLTILATALIETESRMDEVIFEEFKGTGNMELHLDRELIDRRIFPAIHIPKSGTRKEELLYHPDEFKKIGILRKALLSKPPFEAMEELVDAIKNTRTNVELLLTGLR